MDGHRARADLPDAASIRACPPARRRTTACRSCWRRCRKYDWKGLTFAGTAEYADFRNPTLVTGQRAYAYPTVAWTQAGTGVVLHRDDRRARAALQPQRHDARPRKPGLRDPDLVARRRPRVRARLERVRPELRADAGAARLLRLRAVQGPEQGADLRHRASTTTTSRSSSAPTAISATTGSATPTRSRSALTSRLLDPATGAERLRVAVGERFYFQDQRVTLNEAPRSASSSDVLVGVEGRLSDAWALAGLYAVQLRPVADRAPRRSVFATRPRPGKAFNASYRYSRHQVDQVGLLSELKQFDLSAQWPISDKHHVARPLELLARRQQDAGGGGGRRV